MTEQYEREVKHWQSAMHNGGSGENYIMMLYSSPKYYWGDHIQKNVMDGASSTYGERRGSHRVLIGKPEGKRPLGRPRRRWEDNIKMDLQEVGCGGKD